MEVSEYEGWWVGIPVCIGDIIFNTDYPKQRGEVVKIHYRKVSSGGNYPQVISEQTGPYWHSIKWAVAIPKNNHNEWGEISL